jgi:deoxynucleoside triphosphate triphosphohydrolase SAMHD1
MSAADLVGRLRKKERFGDLLKRVDAVISPLLKDYVRDLSLPQPAQSGVKAIKDAVWGMIDVSAREAVVIDSPVLQRLRHVRQLGLTYLTYPTAGYSRFEHTLGAMHQAERMLRAIATRSPGPEEILSYLPVVRLAALLHDVGHTPLSHVSERFYNEEECPDARMAREVKKLVEEVAATLEIPATAKLSECLSLAVVLCPSFYNLLTASAGYNHNELATAALSIVGKPPSAASAFVAQIISNVIDADKLDYMFRDAFVTRVPLAVDLERLLYKLRCLSSAPDKLPQSLQKIFSGESNARVLGTDLAGERLAYDLAISRTLLFERVYLHHKTRAAERVALAVLAGLDPCPHPAELLSHDDSLFSQYGRTFRKDLNTALTRMLEYRQLPHRVYAISFGFLAKQAVNDSSGKPILPDAVKDAWDHLNDDLKDFRARTALEQAIVERVAGLCERLGFGRLALQVWIDTPPLLGLNIPELLIERPDGTMHLGESFPANAAAFAQSPHAIFFVYLSGGGQSERELGYIATEVVIAERYQLTIGRLAADYAKINLTEVNRHKRDLEARDISVFAQVGHLRPLSAVARLASNERRIRALVERFGTYHIDDRNVRVDEKRIKAFLDQFPERFVEPMLAVLEHLHFLHRSALGSEFGNMLRMGASSNSTFAPLTKGPEKSAAHLAYFLADSPSDLKSVMLDEALKQEGNITFFDESTLSGKQARTVLQIWFDYPLDLPEEADLARPLSNEERDRLRTQGIRLRFLYGLPQGIEHIKELTRELGLGEDVVAFSVENGLSCSLETTPGLTQVDELRAFLRDIGNELHLSTNLKERPEKWTTQRCQERALGYSNLEQLLVFGYNTPTATLTALWKGGIYRKTPWLPLFPRRGEKSPPLLSDD